MNRISKIRWTGCAAALLLVGTTLPATAQQRGPAASPAASVSQTLGSTTITVTYSRPGVKDRVVFGELQKWGEVWRAGANAVTTVEVSGDVTVNGKTLKAGKYGLHVLLRENGMWTAIFTDQPEVWGIPYQEGHDVLRVDVQTRKAPAKVEWLTYSFKNLSPERPTKGELVLAWDMVEMPLMIDTTGGM